MATVTVDEDELLDLAKKAAAVSAALNAIPTKCFDDIDTDKEELVDYVAEIGQGLLVLRNRAKNSNHRKTVLQ